MKHATFFGGAIREVTPEYGESIAIGELLAEKGYTVKCGGYFGLMEAVCQGVSNKKGHSIGITCATFKNTKGNEYLSETIVATDIFDRLKLLLSDSTVFIIQKGGIGTLSELALLIDINRKESDQPTIIIFGDEWNQMILGIKQMMSEKDFAKLNIYNFSEFEKHKEEIENLI